MNNEEPPDDVLIDRTLAGEREAFGQIYDRHARAVFVVVGSVTNDWTSADDLVQESFLRAHRKLGELRDRSRFRFWMLSVARHVAREHKRSMRRDRHEFFATIPTSLEPSETESSRLERDEEWNAVARQLATLPEHERLAVHAFFLEERDGNQAAALLGLSRSGFYGALQRGMARLASRLKTPEPKKHGTR